MALLIISSAEMFCRFACAEAAGSGHYLPGATSSFIDLMPDRETSTFAYLNLRRRRLPQGQELPPGRNGEGGGLGGGTFGLTWPVLSTDIGFHGYLCP